MACALLFIFTLINLGIKAFSLGGGFGSVVNSTMPLSGGSGATASSKNDFEGQSDEKTND